MPGRRDHLPSLAQVRRFYDSDVVIDRFTGCFAGHWHTPLTLSLPGTRSAERLVCGMLRLGPHHDLLDFGCGVGGTTCMIAQRVGCRARGLNISPRQVMIAQEVASRLGLADRVGFDCYPGRELPYPAASFDRVVFFESPCHVPHKRLLFEQLFRVLKRGGACAGQDWVLATDRISAADRAAFIRPIEVATEVELCSLDRYRELMTAAGFANIQALDARDLAATLGDAFTAVSPEPVHVARREPLAARLTKGNTALSNAFHRGLFTIGFLYGEKPAPRSTRRQANDGRRRDAAATPSAAGLPRPAPPLVAPEACHLGVYSRKKNLACLSFHRAAFDVPDSRVLAAFSALVESSACCTLESSCKVDAAGLQSARWNLFCHGDNAPDFLAAALRLFDDYAALSGAPLNLDLLRGYLSAGIDFSQVRKVVTGVDLRAAPGVSRAKLWLMLARAPDLVERAIALHGDGRVVRALRFHDDFLVGFDLRFDGTCGVKLYPDVRPEELGDSDIRQRLRRFLSSEALTAMGLCLWTHIYLAHHNPDTVLQLHPADPDDFVARHLPPRGREIHAAYAGVPLLDMVVAVPERELHTGEVRSFALYYMPAEAPAAARGQPSGRGRDAEA